MIRALLIALATLIALQSSPAVAQDKSWAKAKKPVRDFLKDENVADLIKGAKSAVKKACGCNVAIRIDVLKFSTNDDVFRSKDVPGLIQSCAETYCTDKASKKEFCANIKTVVAAYGPKETEPMDYDARSGTLTTYVKNTRNGWDDGRCQKAAAGD